MTENLQLVLGGTGSDVFLAGFVAPPKVVRNKHTGQSFWLKSVEGDTVTLEPISGSEVVVSAKNFDTESWESIR